MFKLSKQGDARPGAASDVEAFIQTAARTPAPRVGTGRGRLIFALDATLSRQPTWELATDLQARMFDTTSALGGLDVQLCYFRGSSECRASPFVSGGAGLAGYMRSIRVAGGMTQIGRVLGHARDEAQRAPVGALVFVGDALEEASGPLLSTAGELALLGVKAFMFQEGSDARVTARFGEIARVTGGAFARFDRNAPDVLASLLAAAAAYAAGGRAALEVLASRTGSRDTTRLLAQLR